MCGGGVKQLVGTCMPYLTCLSISTINNMQIIVDSITQDAEP